ncbi:PASTA domain-containing protein [Marinilabilia rubra]|uniref:Penicillin-binding protein n=1 Tax=Marinilabilia rubra TaxID=2162893 RepID=A0A2U2B8A5_9BACT|nr:PASTA domain-containing protein [Marinilabilia rubra]PWD99298.1 penicillin-binding protein [Marinilabilia rubra]
MSFFKTIFSKPFGKHVGILFLAGCLIIFLAFMGLRLYTRHGNGFEVPDFTGLTEKQFKPIVDKNDLRYAIVDSIYVDDVPPGIVIEQTPEAGSMVKKNRNIFFTINSWAPEKVQMPDVIDYSIRNARVMLESFGLKVGQLIYVPSEYTNLVLGQHYKGKPIEAGKPLERGAVIDLIVGKGLSNQTTAVPDLIGLYFDEAREVSQNLSLNIGAQIYDTTVVSKEDTLNAFIWKQRPDESSDRQLRLGASIDIWLTTDSSFIMPDSALTDSVDIELQEEIIIDNNEDFESTEEEEKFF